MPMDKFIFHKVKMFLSSHNSRWIVFAITYWLVGGQYRLYSFNQPEQGNNGINSHVGEQV